MGNGAAIPPMPSAEEWERCCQQAETAVRNALNGLGLREARKAQRPSYSLLMLAMGSLVASADLLKLLADGGGDRRVVEEMAVAYVRGGIRGLDDPVQADGSSSEGARVYDA